MSSAPCVAPYAATVRARHSRRCDCWARRGYGAAEVDRRVGRMETGGRPIRRARDLAMADQGRWFKVWTSILDDPDFQELSLEDVGRWALLGAMTKLVGTSGVLVVNGTGRRL